MVDKSKLGALAAKITRIVPGIDSYQEKECLRNIDKQLRNQLADLLTRARDHIEEVERRYARQGNLEPLDDLDRLTRTMQRLSDTIRHAAYGWSPVFDEASVDKQRLEQIHSFDQSLEDTIIAVHAEVEKLSAASTGDLDAAIRHVERSLSSLEEMVEERDCIMRAR
ncbi:MAG TPA: hypothetical protein PLG17_12915 [Thermodesulfobacteriota bacterium]|nr:hypothetical protein [Thermodesulfobacteriota bacterium]HNU71672.1 hypothetical protein [Thermodesulfobacteriota bacterium]HOC38279.1 hypothetical protein [Thermodesulfobacteriota bacterium]HQO79398.1 hypothetical protein [Thermodesulfobacteriota bacterium]